MRRILVVLGIVVAVVVIGLLVAVSLIDVNKYKPRIQTELQSKLDRPVTLGELHLRLFPLSVRVDGVTVGEAAAFPSPQPFAKASELYASVGLFSLLSGSPEVKAIELTHPQIEVIRNAQGVWNFSSLGGTRAKQPSSSTSTGGLTLDKLKITDGQVALTDELKHQARSVYDHIDAELTDFAPNKPFNVDLNIHLPGQGKQLMSLSAKAGPVQGVAAAAVPVNGHFTLDEVSLASFSRFASGAIPPNTDAVLSGGGTIESANETLAAKGNLKFQNTVVHGVKIDYPIEAKYDLSDNRKTDLLTIRSGQVTLGATPISVSGNYDSGKKPAVLDLKVKARNASVTELARLAGAFGVAMNPQYQVKGSLNADIAAKGPETAPELSGSVQTRQVEASGGEIKQPVKVPEVDLTLSPTAILSNSFVAQSGSTRLTIAFTLSQYTTPSPVIDATVKTDGADMAELLNVAKTYGIDAAKGMTGTGKLSLDVHVLGPLKQTAKLVYSGSGNLSNVTLNTPRLTKPLAVHSASLHFAQNGASIDGLSASVGSTTIQGNMSAKNFAEPQVQFALSSDKIDSNELQNLEAGKPEQSATHTAHNHEPSLLSKTTGTGTIAANTIIAQEFVLTNVKATATLNRGLITLSPLTANIFGGSEAGSITLDTRPATSTCAVKAKFSGVDTDKLLSAVSSVKNKLYGTLTADANLGFALVSSSALARTLNGNVSFDVANGQLTGINILNELSRIGKFLGAAPAQNQSATALKKFSGTLNIQNGVATTNNLVAELNEGSLSANGALNLVDQVVNMHATAVLASGISQSVGGAKVGGFLNTALANNKGELVLPVIVTGNMNKPIFAPDAEAMAQMKLKNLLPTTGDPGKLTTGAIGSVLGKNQGGAAGAINSVLGGKQGGTQAQPNGQQQQQPADVINGVLGQFGHKKQPQK